jgi:uncharacterized phage protein (TIGR02220 family)
VGRYLVPLRLEKAQARRGARVASASAGAVRLRRLHDDATIRVKTATGWANLCRAHYDAHHGRVSRSWCAERGLGTVSQMLSGSPPDAPPPEKPKGNGHALNAEAETVLAYLNRATGRSFQFRNPKGELTPNANVIIARLKEEYTGEQLREVVMLKAEQWRGDAKMGEFLRPETLFGKTKFATYVGELSTSEA